ncbi:YetF domain-containing protein [Cytobacillus sp. FJAT-54145]|uniref:YetF domain-containing protein n=1 Tax=Cytobacillus spartinae TaxID=3299023 RepID=A0ABW6KGD7_9BACI
MENLKKLNLDTKWLEQKLSQGGINSISEVFYAEVQKDGTLYIDSKNDVVH